jgi:hypothetical protein
MPIQIEGLADLSQMLTELAPNAAKRYLSRAGEAAAEVVIEALDDTVPVGVGILEESITWDKHWLDGDETTMEINIGPTKQAFWGMFQEFGTQEVTGADRNGKKFHHAAQPAQRWMTNAWLGCRDKCLDVFATEAVGILQDLENRS